MSGSRARTAWFAPDLALVAAAVTLFYCLFLFQGYQKLFRDSDAGWHIRNGEAILATHELPRTDPYSFTRAGEPWFAWEWGSDVIVGAIHRAAGLSGVAMFYGVADRCRSVDVVPAALGHAREFPAGVRDVAAAALDLQHPLAGAAACDQLAVSGGGGDVGGESLAANGGSYGAAGCRVWSLWANLHASFFMAAVIAAIYAVQQRGSVVVRRWPRRLLRWPTLTDGGCTSTSSGI